MSPTIFCFDCLPHSVCRALSKLGKKSRIEQNNEISTTVSLIQPDLGECTYLDHMHCTKYEDLL